MPYFLECHHSIGQPVAAPLSSYRWEQIAIGDGHDAGFADQNDPALDSVIPRLLMRPDIIGVRLVFHPHAVDPLPKTFHDTIPQEAPGPPVPAPADGAVMRTVGR